MQHKNIFTLAVLSAALLPMSGIHAQGDNPTAGSTGGDAGMAAGTQDVGEFRESLTGLRDLFTRMQENNNLALASQDKMLASQYQDENYRLRSKAMGILTKVGQNWRRMDTSSTASERLGTRDMARYAGESEDTAFVRNTVWQLQSMLQADKLNGRGVSITSEMMDMLNAAVTRSENPSFRVAQAFDSSRLSRIEWGSSSSGASSASASGGGGSSAMTARREWVEPTIQHENLPARNQVATEETAVTEETTEMVAAAPPAEERIGAASLPRTGGSPELLYLLGSGIAGFGGLLLRRRR